MDELTDTFHGLGVNTINQEALEKIVHMMKASKLDAISASDLADMLKTTSISENNSNAGTATKVGETSLPPPPFTIPPTPVMNETPALSTNKANLGDFVEGASNFNFTMGSSASKKGNGRKQHKSNSSPSVLSKSNMNSNSTLPVPPSAFPFNVAKTDSSDLSPTTSASTFSSNPDVGVFWGTGMNIHTDANAVSYDEKENVNVQSDTHSTAGTGFESFVFGNELPIPPVTSSKAAPKETKAQAAGNVDTKDMPNISFTIPDTGTIAEAMEKANAAKHAAKVALDTAMPHHDPFDRDSDDDSDEDAIWEDEDDSDSQGDRMHNESASDYETTASEEEGENRDKEEKPFREAAWFEGEDSDPESEAAETENEAASGATGGDTASTVDHTYESEGYTTAPWGETEPVSTGNAPVSGVGYDPGSPMDCESNTQSPWGTAIPSTFTSNIDSAPTPVSFTFGAADINSSNTSTANTAAPPPAPLENPFAFKPPIVSSTTENLFSAENVGFSLGSTGSSTGKKKPHKAASPNVPAKPKDPIFGSSTLPTDIKFDILGNVLPTPPPKSPEKSNMYFNKRTNQYYEISDDSDDEKGGQSNNKSSKSTVSAESVMKSMSDMNVNDATGAGSYPSVRQPSSIPPPPPPKAAKNVIPPPPPHPSAAVKNGPAPTPTPDSASSKLNPSMTLVADTHRKHGKEYYEKEDYLKALDSFTKALQVSPSDWFYRATVLGNRAATFMMVDRYKECADDCQQAIEIDPTLIRLNSRKGRALCKLGHLEAAAESFTKVLEIVAKSANENAATKMGSAYASTSARISAAAAVASSTKENESNKEDAKVGLKQLSQARELVAYITNFDVKDGWADALSGAKASTFQSSNIMQKIDLLLDLCPQMRIAQAYKAKAYVKAGAFDDAKEFIESTVCHTHETILKLQNPEGVPCSGGIEAPFSCPSIKDLDWSINSNATKGEAIQAKLSFIARFILVIGTDSANGQLSLWYLNALKNLEFSRNYSTEMIKKVCCVLETITTQTDHKSGGFNQTKSSSSKAQWLSDELDKVTQISVLKTEADNLFKAGSFAEAIRIYSDMLKVDATAVRWNAVAHGNRAAAYMSLNCYPEAINDCNKAIQLDIDYNKIYLRRARAHKASHHYAACMRDYRRYLASDPVPLDGVAIQKEMEASARDRDAYLNQKNKEASAGSRGATMADKARPNYWDYYSRANEEGDDLPKNKAGVYGKTKNSKPSSDESSNDSGVWSGSSDDEDESYFNRYHGTTNKSKNLSRESYNNFKKQTRDNEFNSAYSQSKNSAYPPPPPESFRPKPTGNGAANTMPPPPPPASKKTSSSTATDAKKSEEPVKDRDYFYNYYFNGKPPNKAGNKNSTKAAPTATKPEPAQSTKTENPYAKYNNDYYRGKNAYKSPYEGTYNSTNSTANSKYYNYKAGDKSSSGDTSKNSSGNNYNYKNPYDSYYKETRNTSSSNSTNSKSSNHFSGSSSSKSTSSSKRVTEKTDYYELLGVNSRTATERDIKTAYRKLALKYHPDKNKDAGAVEMFQYLTNAYTVLSDKTSRRKYDISKPF